MKCRKEILSNQRNFNNVYRKGSSRGGRYVVVLYKKNRLPVSRIAFVASKKVGNSVVRHRLKRIIRESYRLHEQEFQTGLDIVVVARVSAKDRDYAQIESALLHLGKIRKIVKEMKREDDEADINRHD